MPLFIYKCPKCERTLEQLQASYRETAPLCPTCADTPDFLPRMERVPSAPAVQFKGGGWAADGYASNTK